MRYRVTYDLHTSLWHAYAKRMDVRASSVDHARALVERAVYARKDAILAERHDCEGDGFRVEVTGAVALTGGTNA